MSLRRPTVARLLITFDISPLCDVAQTSDCGTHCHLFSTISPLWGVALTPDCGIVISFVSFRGVIQKLDWPSVLHWDFGRTTARLPFYFPCIIIFMSDCTCKSVLRHRVYICYNLCSNYLASTFIVLTHVLHVHIISACEQHRLSWQMLWS